MMEFEKEQQPERWKAEKSVKAKAAEEPLEALPVPRRFDIGVHLKKFREQKGHSVRSLAALLETSPSRISKLENGALQTTAEYVELFSEKLKLKSADRELLNYFHRIYAAEYLPEMRSLSAEIVQQEMIAELEQSSKKHKSLFFGLIPFVLQTQSYTKRLYELENVHPVQQLGDVLNVWSRRKKLMRARKDNEFKCVIFESALRNRIADEGVMAEQLESLLKDMGAPPSKFDLRIVPQNTALLYYPSCSFELFNDRVVSIGLYGGITTISHPVDVQRYLDVFEKFYGSACDRAASVQLIKEVLASYRVK